MRYLGKEEKNLKHRNLQAEALQNSEQLGQKMLKISSQWTSFNSACTTLAEDV